MFEFAVYFLKVKNKVLFNGCTYLVGQSQNLSYRKLRASTAPVIRSIHPTLPMDLKMPSKPEAAVFMASKLTMIQSKHGEKTNTGTSSAIILSAQAERIAHFAQWSGHRQEWLVDCKDCARTRHEETHRLSPQNHRLHHRTQRPCATNGGGASHAGAWFARLRIHSHRSVALHEPLSFSLSTQLQRSALFLSVTRSKEMHAYVQENRYHD